MTPPARPEAGPCPAAAADPGAAFPAPCAVSLGGDEDDPAGAILAAFRGLDPALVLVFGAPRGGLAALGRALRGGFGPGCRVVGCSSAGEIGPAGYGRDSVVALGFPAAVFRAQICVLENQAQVPVSDWIRSLRAAHARFRPDPGRAAFGVLLADARARHEEVLVAALDAAIPGLPVIGGSAAQGAQFLPACQTVDGEPRPGAALLVLIETRLAIAEVVFAHFRPTDRRAVVTAADPQDRIIHELNAEPAAREYARLAGIPPEALSPTEFARHPLLLRMGRHHHVRAIRDVTAQGGLRLMSGIEPGHILTLGRVVDMTRGFAEVMDALPRPPLMVLGFDCILRRLALERAGMAGQMSDLLARYRVAGCNSWGEQHSGMHVNQTFVGMALMPPPPAGA